MNPTFLVDSNRKKITITWSESSADVELRQRAKELGQRTAAPPAATEASVLMFLPDQITALESDSKTGATLYSFFPALGVAYITSQVFDSQRKNTHAISVFSVCEYSWQK